MGELRIIVTEGRWNFVGMHEPGPTAATIRGARVVRYWGTTKGLGEIAASGPTSKTILDPCGTVEIPNGKIIFTMACDPESWK